MSRQERSQIAPDEPAVPALASSGWLFGVGFLLAARYLQPPEAVAFGETLWQCQLWIVMGAIWCWQRFRGADGSITWSGLDVCVWVIALGHAISTVPVLVEGGDRRAAVNVTWEWVGLATTLFVVRQVCRGQDRRRLLTLFAAMMVGLAALGVWQHHVGLAQTGAEYDAMISLEAGLRSKVASGEATRSDREELDAVQRQLAEAGVPADEAARSRWENRVKFSTEPFATFALANTFGGLLAAALPVLVAFLWPMRRSASWGVIAAGALMVLYCLFLTKSRTAWVGLTAGGLSAIGVQMLRGRVDRKILAVAAGGLGTALFFGFVAIATGGLDLEVLSEAPKSLRYRFDYWTGTMGVLAERPLLGTGPGNFRSHYLEHRVLGASEEIAAPHNLFLDVWVSGGLVGLAGLLGLLSLVAARLLSFGNERNSSVEAHLASWGMLEWGATVAFPIVTGVLFLAGLGIDDRLLLLCPLFAAVLACFGKFTNEAGVLFVGAGAGFVGLAVHLLGADGMELPTVVQTLLVLALFVDRVPPQPTATMRGSLLSTLVFSVFAIGCLLTGLVPVLNSAALMARAESLVAMGDPAADRILAQATEADSLGIEPLVLRAELASSKALRSKSRSDFDTATRRWREVLEADPWHLQARLRLGELLLSVAADEKEEGAASEAVVMLEQAVRLSPTDVELHARLATAFDLSGQATEGAESARRALEIDDVNRAAGHTDIMLSEARRLELMSLADVGKPVAEP